jgi:ferrous iron transport protein A
MNDLSALRLAKAIGWRKLKLISMFIFLKSKLKPFTIGYLYTMKLEKSNAMYKRLSEIKIGKTVVIRSFENDEIFLKLMEMGCVPGENITVDQIAPFRDPISISVAGYQLSLRLNEADHIIVEEI